MEQYQPRKKICISLLIKLNRPLNLKNLICWGAYPPDDLDLERGPGRLADSGLILVRGLSDRRAMEESHHMQEERLFKMNVPFRTLTHPGGHDLDAGLLQNLAR